MRYISDTVIVDADSHVEEHPVIWERLDKKYANRKPLAIEVGDAIQGRPERNVVWLIDGRICPKLMGHGATCHGSPPLSEFAKRKPVTIESQAMTDPTARLRDLDSAGIDVTTLFPTLFLEPITDDLPYEAALMRAYNDYMAEACEPYRSRLKWVAPVPLREVNLAINEMKRTQEKGAVAVMVLATAGGRLLHDSVLDPFWAEAETSRIPICVHVGWPHPGLLHSCNGTATSMLVAFELSMPIALFSFLGGGILDRFPKLKVAFVEGALQWYPIAIERMEHWRSTPTAAPWPTKNGPQYYLRERDVYFTCEGNEHRLAEFVEIFGQDRLMASADFPHVHYDSSKLSTSFDALACRDDLADTVKERLMGTNAVRFFQLQ